MPSPTNFQTLRKPSSSSGESDPYTDYHLVNILREPIRMYIVKEILEPEVLHTCKHGLQQAPSSSCSMRHILNNSDFSCFILKYSDTEYKIPYLNCCLPNPSPSVTSQVAWSKETTRLGATVSPASIFLAVSATTLSIWCAFLGEDLKIMNCRTKDLPIQTMTSNSHRVSLPASGSC